MCDGVIWADHFEIQLVFVMSLVIVHLLAGNLRVRDLDGTDGYRLQVLWPEQYRIPISNGFYWWPRQTGSSDFPEDGNQFLELLNTPLICQRSRWRIVQISWSAD
ncbi:MAG: hypothetical protein CM1200mP24_08380 [Gammaproteobacteria bacterium]|nr:MAG: hypothetical protein CM1200mP24_08380 [Gammaproteobacteria bacterium]